MDKAARWLETQLDYRFDDQELLRQALTHRSASQANNERLEFLGDAILDLVISESLFRLYPDADEGDLSRLRSSLVRDTSLARIATELGIGEHLVLGSGELKSGGQRRKSILADAVEAIFGAALLDRGYEAARGLIERVFGEPLMNLPDVAELRDAKTRLQEWLQKRGFELPHYETVDVDGDEHARQFTVQCRVDAKSAVTRGTAGSRRAAEQKAAREMLQQLRGDTA